MNLRNIDIDKGDLLFWGGLILLGVGLYIRAPWLAFTVPGAILVLVSIMGAIRK